LFARVTGSVSFKKMSAKSAQENEVQAHIKKAKYAPDARIALITLATTLVMWVASAAAYLFLPWWVVVPIRSGVFVRVFMIFHDACHNSFTPSTWWNQMIARALSIVIITSSQDWRNEHNFHHRHLGDESIEDKSRTVMHSVEEYESMSPPVRVMYRIFRDPFIFFPLAGFKSFYVPLVWQFQTGAIGYAAILAAFYWCLGSEILKVELLSHLIACTWGVVLFHLQHQVNPNYVATHEMHSVYDAGMKGSSFLHVPFFLKWVTLGIEYHHIHHVSTRVPCYKLQECHEDGEALGIGLWNGITQVTPKGAFKALFHSLWDKKKERFVSFPLYASLGLQD